MKSGTAREGKQGGKASHENREPHECWTMRCGLAGVKPDRVPQAGCGVAFIYSSRENLTKVR
jgi:hypothetical protein